MSQVEKMFADVMFDETQGVYRGSVEYYHDDFPSPVIVPVEFTGEKNVTFADLEQFAFKRAHEILKSLTN